MQSIYPYSPRKSSFEDLKLTFVGRETLLDELISSIRDQATAETLQHWMILGTRGMGKSHIITMVHYIIKQDEYIGGSWTPVLMNEEEQGVFSLHTLFIRIMTKLGEELSRDEAQKSEEISAFLDSLRSGNKTQDKILESVVAYLKDYVAASGKRLLILLENADDVFTRYLPQKNEVRKFRNILQHDNFLLLLATSPTFFEGISKGKAPLYEFFRLRRLTQLNYDQAVKLLNRWAHLEEKSVGGKSPLRFKKDDYRLKVLYHLTGGNPRILLFLYMAVRGQYGIVNAVDTFTRLLEEDLSSFYLSRMRDLSSQVQPIVLALAESEYNLTQTAIARKTFLPARSIGTAMMRLESDGIVRPVTEKKGKNTLYTLTDQLFRLWHQWRTSFRERQVIMAIVEFLAIWYRKRELKKMAAYEDLTGTYTREALIFRETEKFKGYWEAFHVESGKYIKEYLTKKDYPSLFKTLKLLEETGYKTDQLSRTAIADLDDRQGLDEGERFFREKTEDYPEDIEAWMNLGSIYFRKKSYTASERVFKKVTGLDPKNVKAWMYLGFSHIIQKNHAEAEMAISKAVELRPEDARVWVGLGLIRDIQENYTGAEEAYAKAVELDPEDKTAWRNLGVARFNQENYAGAEEAYAKAVELDPKNKTAWLGLGAARFNQENHAGAEEAFGKALKLDPTDISTYSSLGEIMIRNGRMQDLLNLLNKALSLKKTAKHFKAFIRLLRAIAFLFQQDMTPFRKQLAAGMKMMTAIDEEQKHSIVGEVIDLMVEIIDRDNLKTIRTFINESEKTSADIAALFNPINHVIDYFEELYSNQKGQKMATDRAQRLLDSITSEVRGPVEKMIQRVEKNIGIG